MSGVCVLASMRACAPVGVRECVCVHVCVFAIYDYYDISPRLIMIIIQIIILYFIQIRHTDDFPSTGTRLVTINSRCRRFDLLLFTGLAQPL